jgi:hypothetical protein
MKIIENDKQDRLVVQKDEYDSNCLEGGLLWELINSIELDFVIAGDEGCASNWDMYYPLYSHYSGKLFLVLGKDCADYQNGKPVELLGKEPDNDDLEWLRENGVI